MSKLKAAEAVMGVAAWQRGSVAAWEKGKQPEVCAKMATESAARAIVTVSYDAVDTLVALARERGVPVRLIGATGGSDLSVEGQFTVPLAEVRSSWAATLPAALA